MFATIALVVIVVAVLVSPFHRRIGGKGGGSETTAFGAWLLLAVIVAGALFASR